MAYFPKWGYSDGQCLEYIWGGCLGNPQNRFDSEEECQRACMRQKRSVCTGPAGAIGPCEAIKYKWTFDGTDCVQFVYGGCGGNKLNRFDSQEECQNACLNPW